MIEAAKYFRHSLAVLLVIAVVLGYPVAQAGTGTISACWNTKSGELHVVKSTAKCATGQTLITVAATGGKVKAAATVFGMGRIDGRVQSACTVEHPGDPVLDVVDRYTIHVPGHGYLLKTDADGGFHFDAVVPGSYRLVAERRGRAAFDVGTFAVVAGKATVIPTTLAPCAILCGNSFRETVEQCDGLDLGGSTCQTQGFASGTLTCTNLCAFDTSACVPP